MSPPSHRPGASNGPCNPSTVSSTSDLVEASHLPERRYETRPIHYRGHVRDILYHDGGGSSPLLGICNSLLLTGKIQLDIPTGTGPVSENYLVSLLEDQINANYPVFMQDESMRSFVRHSLMSFACPLTLNVNFTSTKSFGDPGENVLALVIFQLCNLTLFHGWVVDPQEIALSEALDNKSHDSLKAAFGEYMSKKQAGLDYSVVEHDKWNLIREFLYRNSLTSHGLSCLREDMSEQEIGVLFWRNQFSTMMKYNEELYLLQTDVGFISTNAVWLRVDEVNYSLGDYMTCCFVPLGKEVSMTLSAGENELFLLKLLLNLRALVAHHTPICIYPFFQLVGKMILAESDDTKRVGYLNTLMSDLEQQEICTFYQSVFKMIQAEPDNTNSEEYLKRLMSFFKEELVMDHLPSESPDANKVSEKTYKTRQIHFEGRLTHIVYQEDDGPCALLGICNSLLLTDKIRLDILNDMGEVSENYLLSRLMAHISTSHPDLVWDIPMQSFARKELMSYVKGALVNVNFTSTRAFGEMGENVIVVGIFEVSGATLFHGWVVDPQDIALSEALGNKSHDSLMVELGEYVSKMEGGLEFSTVDSAKWNLIHQFLHGNSLTPHGLSCLREDTKEEEVCVLLWRNHFSTMMKHNGELYLLQTDVGFLTTDIVWQRLSEDGCGEYMTCCFTPVVEAPMTVFASENEHLNLEFLVNLRPLISHHMPNRINTFFQLVGKHILSESDDTKREWYLNKLVAELEQHEIHLFYQSACEMIRAESDNGKYLKRLMSLSNEKLAEITAVEGQIVDIRKEDNALSVISILQMNVCVASSLGPQFFPQISHVSSDMLTLYSLCSKLISKQLVDEGCEDGLLPLELQCLRSVKMEILKLVETVVVKAEDLPQLQKQFILPLVDSVLSDYNRVTIEHEVLSLFSTVIIKFSSDMLEGVSRIFDAVFQDTPEINKKPEHCSNLFSLLHVIGTHCFQVLTNNSCERLNHVMDYIIWALKQREINIVETVLFLLLDVLQNVQASGFQNQFYKTNLFRIQQTILTVLMDMPNNSCSELHISVLQHLFNAVDVLTEPLISSAQCNMMFVRDCTIKVLGSAFPGMTDKIAQKFVDGLLNSKGDNAGFLNHTRQFLAQLKETCTQVAQEQKSVDASFSPRNDLADLCCLARDSLPLVQTAPSSATTSITHFGTLLANFSGVTSKWKPLVIGTDKTHGGDWTVVTSKRKARRFKESESSSDTGLESLASAAAASKLFPSSANAGTSSVVPFTEFIKLPGNAITAKRTIFSGANSMEVDETTLLGRRSVTSYLHKMTAEHVLGNSWNGTLQKKDFVVVDDSKFIIWKPATVRCSPDALLKDYGNFASEFLPLFGEAALFKALRNSLRKFRPRYFTRDLARKFRFFIMTHLAIKSATIRSHFWTELGRVHRFLSKEGRNALSAALRGFMVQVPDWTQLVKCNPTLLEVYNYREEKDKKKEEKKKQPQGSTKVEPVKVVQNLQNYGDLVYNSSLESLLTFIRNCMQHLGEPGEDGKAKIKRLIEIDLLLSHILLQMPRIMERLIFSPCLTEEVSVMLNDVWDLLLVTEGMIIDKSLFDA